MKLKTLQKLQVDYKQDFKCVSVYDEAIDLDQSNIEEYYKTRNLVHLKFKQGIKPTYYFLRILPVKLVALIIKNEIDLATVINFFQWCLYKVENLKIGNEVIPNWEADFYLKNDQGTKSWDFPIISETEMNAENGLFSYALIREIGGVAVARHFLVRGTDLSLEVPPSLTQSIRDLNRNK